MSPAALATDPEPVCDACLSHDGLCLAHAKSVLPQLAQPSWVRLIGAQRQLPKKAPAPSTAAERAMRRNARRLVRAINGEFTRSRRATA